MSNRTLAQKGEGNFNYGFGIFASSVIAFMTAWLFVPDEGDPWVIQLGWTFLVLGIGFIAWGLSQVYRHEKSPEKVLK